MKFHLQNRPFKMIVKWLNLSLLLKIIEENLKNTLCRDWILLEILAKCERIFNLASSSYIKLANFSEGFFFQSIRNSRLIPLSSISVQVAWFPGPAMLRVTRAKWTTNWLRAKSAWILYACVENLWSDVSAV